MILPLSSCYNKENREEILKVYNWGDYIDEDILAEFPKWYEEQTGKKVFEAMSDKEAYAETVNLAYFFGEEGRKAHLNPIMYPDSTVVARCAMIYDAGDHTPEVLDMWSKVKGDNLGGGIVIFLLAVVLGLTVFVSIKKIEHYKHRRLSRKHRRHHIIKVKG